MTAQDIAQEINCKLGYYHEVFKGRPDLLENLVIIIPENKYDILSELAIDYFAQEVILHDAISMRFDRFMGVPLKVAQELDKIYIALNLDYEDNVKRLQQEK